MLWSQGRVCCTLFCRAARPGGREVVASLGFGEGVWHMASVAGGANVQHSTFKESSEQEKGTSLIIKSYGTEQDKGTSLIIKSYVSVAPQSHENFDGRFATVEW